MSSISEQRERDNVVPFRRGRGEVRPFRRSPLRKWLKPFSAALAIVGLPTALVAWTMTAQSFAVREVVLETGPRVPEEWVVGALQPLVGSNLLLVSLSRVENLLRRHPWVLRADLRKELPTRLIVTVTEKRAVAILRRETELYYLDIEGSAITPFDPLAGPTDLILISRASALDTGVAGGDQSNGPASSIRRSQGAAERGVAGQGAKVAIQIAEEMAQVAPQWSAGLSEIVILGEEDFKLYTTSMPFPLLVRAGTLREKAHRLEALLPQIVDRYGTEATIDLRFARRIIVQPSALIGRAPTRSRPAAAYREAALDHVQHG